MRKIILLLPLPQKWRDKSLVLSLMHKGNINRNPLLLILRRPSLVRRGIIFGKRYRPGLKVIHGLILLRRYKVLILAKRLLRRRVGKRILFNRPIKKIRSGRSSLLEMLRRNRQLYKLERAFIMNLAYNIMREAVALTRIVRTLMVQRHTAFRLLSLGSKKVPVLLIVIRRRVLTLSLEAPTFNMGIRRSWRRILSTKSLKSLRYWYLLAHRALTPTLVTLRRILVRFMVPVIKLINTRRDCRRLRANITCDLRTIRSTLAGCLINDGVPTPLGTLSRINMILRSLIGKLILALRRMLSFLVPTLMARKKIPLASLLAYRVHYIIL